MRDRISIFMIASGIGCIAFAISRYVLNSDWPSDAVLLGSLWIIGGILLHFRSEK